MRTEREIREEIERLKQLNAKCPESKSEIFIQADRKDWIAALRWVLNER